MIFRDLYARATLLYYLVRFGKPVDRRSATR